MRETADTIYPNKGSAESRLSPRIAEKTITRFGPRMGSPAIHKTSTRSGPTIDDNARRGRIGLPDRFFRS